VTLGAFLKTLRMRIHGELCALGPYERLSSRRGKRVTQEEAAEAIGVSRVWYATLESDARVRASTGALSRLADVLMLSADERVRLFQLAIPDLVRLTMQEQAPVASPASTDFYEALRDVRQTVKRLWWATSEGEIVQVAGEEARRLLPHFELVFARRIVVPEDDALLPYPRRGSGARLAVARADTLRRIPPELHVRLDALWQRAPAGVLLSSEAYTLDIVRVVRLMLREHGITWGSPVSAHILGPRGSAHVGGMSTRPHHVTELERTILSTIADFASLAMR
jgi:transcriptional regulator with XRE-family HTH domain